jgi:hypothetical protein
MREVVILVVVIAVIAIVWYTREGRGQAIKQRAFDDAARTPEAHLAAARADSPVREMPPGTPASAVAPSRPGKGAGLLQDAAESAAGVPYERAADQIERMTGDLAEVRRDAERNAEQLATRAAEAFAAIQAATAARDGAVPGDGTDRCPGHYPIKAILATMRYLTPDETTYNPVVPDICLESVAAAEAAGFRGSEADAAAAPRTGSLEGDGGKQTLADSEP